MKSVSSTQHIEAFLRGVDAMNRLDATAVLEMVDDETVFEPLRSATEGAYIGPEGMRGFLADTAETFEMFKVSYTDIRDLGDERLLAIGSLRMRGRGSGVESDVPSAAVVQFRDGVMQEFKDYGDAAVALEVADVSG
jgi:ketosteroid isomerase-like protein